MAENRAEDVVDRMIKGMMLDPARDKIPSKIADSILPSFVTNIPLPRLRQIIDAVENDSDKIITVPAGKTWKILWGEFNCVASATAGSRQFRIEIQNQIGNTIMHSDALNVQTASTTEYYSLFQGFGAATETVAGFHRIPIPADLWLLPNFKIRIYDINAIDAAVDDTVIKIMVEEYHYELI